MLKAEWSHLVVDSMREALPQTDPQSPRVGVQRSLYKREREGGMEGGTKGGRDGGREGRREGGRDRVREGRSERGRDGGSITLMQALLASHVSACAYYLQVCFVLVDYVLLFFYLSLRLLHVHITIQMEALKAVSYMYS